MYTNSIIKRVLLIFSLVSNHFSSNDYLDLEPKRFQKEYIYKNGLWNKTVEHTRFCNYNEKRLQMTHQAIFYNDYYERLNINEAYTVFSDIQYHVSNEMMADLTLPSSIGFGATKQTKLCFSKVNEGAITQLNYQLEAFRTPFKNNYQSIYLPSFYNKEIHLESEIPLQFTIVDPQKNIKMMRSDSEGSSQHTRFVLKPFSYYSEGKGLYLNRSQIPCVYASSFRTDEEIGNLFAEEYDLIKKQPLPDLFKKIAQIADRETDEIAVINRVTDLLIKNITYFSDSRHGGMIPQDLDVIAASCTGDCKDYAISTAAILERLGFEAYPVIVYRGLVNQPICFDCVPLNRYNHAIVKVISDAGNIYWIDPTNITSMAGGVFPDIADRDVLVLKCGDVTYEKTAEVDMAHAQLNVEKTCQFYQDSDSSEQMICSLSGEIANPVFGFSFNYYIKGYILNTLLEMDLTEEELDNVGLMFPVKDKQSNRYSCILTLRNKANVFSLGNKCFMTVKQNNSFILQITQVPKNARSDLYLGHPQTRVFKTIYDNHPDANEVSEPYLIDTPWFSLERNKKDAKRQTEIKDVLVIKKTWITMDELNSIAFRKAQKKMKQFHNCLVNLRCHR
ncbi:hypothetical protein N9N03_01490 [Chlamydiia bacterium]|nr:hypothetical protein [Chlamydiia bacterium]